MTIYEYLLTHISCISKKFLQLKGVNLLFIKFIQKYMNFQQSQDNLICLLFLFLFIWNIFIFTPLKLINYESLLLAINFIVLFHVQPFESQIQISSYINLLNLRLFFSFIFVRKAILPKILFLQNLYQEVLEFKTISQLQLIQNLICILFTVIRDTVFHSWSP
ncbi:unnamed protein product (macronuclear) [Paramecium tetraurelia]|uniref:Transmembrane protein n=1 Tax=Paramecium tetraurelia TaxID=5888 RepID=A0BEZ1_PARTE|nr:uncharacterized protein GSPATT00028143001 [Paramecium tetraurelia]CAK57108.1 unnamed protein product [Paramecium tetraurelia]|eukprot:XP_001424506.1 hypothetical protein (macronuclear) [Paramecium tetraurelia strain d4-2]